jgi:hypothetical protein
MSESLKRFLQDQRVLWAVAFVGVCVLVGLGKLKPETVEYMLFALFGAATGRRAVEDEKNESE